MRLEENRPPADQGSPRTVSLQRAKQVTFIKCSCNVSGSICFVRADSGGMSSRLIQMFRLLPPEPFSHSVAVFGLSGSTLPTLRGDDELRSAVDALLKAGNRLQLQKGQLVATVSNTKAAESGQVLSACVSAAAVRLEKLAGTSVNEAAGTGRLTLPYTLISVLPAAVFGLCLTLLESSLAPLTIGLYSLAMGLILAVLFVVVVIPVHLRSKALGGAVVSTAVTSALIGSLFLGASLAIIANTWLGEKLLAAKEVQATGTIVVTHGRHTSCWLYLDQPSQDLVQGETFAKLPLQCSEVHYHEDPLPRLYDVKLNPGLLGAPFAQSIEAIENPLLPRYVSAGAIPCHYSLPSDAMPELPPKPLFAAVRISLDAQGQVLDAVLEKSSGSAVFDDLAVRQSRLATCKPYFGPDGKAVPVETNFLFAVQAAALRAAPAADSWAARIARRVRAHIVWNGSATQLQTRIAVHCTPDGKLLSATIIRSSGNLAWDAAALAAVQQADPMPTDNNGKIPEHFTLTVRPGPA
jgi:TonB family protein